MSTYTSTHQAIPQNLESIIGNQEKDFVLFPKRASFKFEAILTIFFGCLWGIVPSIFIYILLVKVFIDGQTKVTINGVEKIITTSNLYEIVPIMVPIDMHP